MENTSSVPANPMGLDLITGAQQALAQFIVAIVQAEVAKAVQEAGVGAAAATLLDDTLNERIRTTVDDYLDDHAGAVTKDWVDNRIESRMDDHTSDFNHDEFLTEIKPEDIEDALDGALGEAVNADDSDFADAVCEVIRNRLS